MKIVVIGGTGLIGSKLVKKLREHGHEAVAASPNTGVNTLTGEGLAEALKGASVVVDVTNSPSWEDAAVLKFFETSTRNLLTYEAAAGVGHHVALSVVGTERLARKRLLPGQDCPGETDQGIFHPLLHRASDAVLRVSKGPRRHLHSTAKRCGCHMCFSSRWPPTMWRVPWAELQRSAGKRHRRNWWPRTVSRG